MNHPRHPLFLALGLALAGVAQAGNLDSSAPPSDPASGMYTLESLYQRLDTGATGSKRAGAFEEPAAGPAATGYTLDQIMAAMPAVDDTDGATAGEVLQGKTFWGLRSDGSWGLNSGSLASQAIDNTQTGQAAGNYAAFDLATEDTDLTSANIKSGANIFGITGKAEVVDTSEAGSPVTAGEILSGKVAFVNGAKITGSLASQSIDNTQTSQAAGNYAVFDLATEDTDLTSANIKSGTTIYGVNGKAEVVDTSEATNAASAADLLSGKVAFVNGAALTGTVAAGANVTGTNGQLSFTIPNGLYTGNKTCTAADSNLAAGNIKSGTTIFGTPGSYSCTAPTGTALAADVLSGTTFSNASGTGISGAMVNVGAQSILPGTTQQTITQGYHDGTGTVTGDVDLITGNIKSGATIFGVTGKTEVVDTTEATNEASAADLLSGKVAFVNGGKITGSLPTQTLSDTSTTVSAGYYATTDLATVDSDLTAANILSGTTLFGITGTLTPSNGVPKTGQTSCYDMATNAAETCVPAEHTHQDGNQQKGVSLPTPRFTDKGNGTVTDNLTGLIWLDNANCAAATRTWATAFSDIDSLNSGGTMNGNNCGDTSNSGSHQTDWRLPNVKELQSLIDFGYFGPALSNAAGTAKWSANDPFSGVQAGYYWSATTLAGSPSGAWVVDLGSGNVGANGKASSYYVWPVRAGQ